MGTFIADLILPLLSYLAESERTTIRKRQEEGIAAARIRGVWFGRPTLPFPDNFAEVYKEWRKGNITQGDAAKRCGLPRSTFRDKTKAWELQEI